MDVSTRTGLRIGTWNLARSGGAERTALIAEQGLDLLCAQEVTRRAFDDITESGVFGWGAFSLDHRSALRGISRAEHLGVALFGVPDIRLRASGICSWLTRPEKFVFADLDVPGWRQPITVASYHAAPGDGKPECTLQVAQWLELQFAPTILGLDANSPAVDHLDHEQSVFHWAQAPYTMFEPALIGPPSARRHRLEDVVRTRQRTTGEFLDGPRTGPLATTFDRSHDAGRPAHSRFDSIWATPEFAVGPLEHLWDQAMGRPLGGSDHAMVVTTLSAASFPRRKRENLVHHLQRCAAIPDGSRLVLNTDLVADDPSRAQLDRWIVEHSGGEALWSNTGNELTWTCDGRRYTVISLVRRICAEAGIELRPGPAGPHWWLDPASGNQSLSQISEALAGM